MLGNVLSDIGFRTYRVFEGVLPSDVGQCDGWLITGSRHSIHDRRPWMLALSELVQTLLEGKMPLVGICFGHQVIADALGGIVGLNPGGWFLGPQTYQFTNLNWIRSQMMINSFHEEQVLVKPECARVIATTKHCPFAALEYGETCLSIQGHPEFSASFMRDLIQVRLEGKVKDLVVGPIQDYYIPVSDVECATRMILEKLSASR